MKVNVCDYCLGGLDAAPKLTISKYKAGFTKLPRLHVCEAHKEVWALTPKPMTGEQIVRRVQRRATAGETILNPPKGKGWRPSELAVTIGGAKADIDEPFWGRAE